MKRIVLFLLGLISIAYGQFAPTSAKTAFKNGISIGTRDSTAYTTNDSLVVVINRQGRMMYRSTDGYWKLLANAASSDYVPYQGAVSNVFLGSNRIKADAFDLGIPSVSADSIGRMRWNADDLTMNIGLTSSVVLQSGQEMLILVKNQTGVTIPNGTVVRQSGVVGASGRLKVEPFLANGTHNSNQVLGLTTEDIPNGGDGFVSYFGKVRGLNTAAYPDSTILYASPTVAGGLTNVVPEAPNNIVKIGTVVKSASSNGIIFTRVVAGSNINQDEGVQLTNPLNNSLLVYDSLTTLWKDKTLVEIGAVRVQDTAAMLLPYLRKSDTATMLSNYRRKTTLIENADLRNSAITINGSSTALGGSISVGTVTSVAASAGTGISVSGSPITSNGTLTITNTAPDQTVTLTAGTGISVSGTYPNFTVTNTSPSSGGTVTSVTASAPLSSSGGTTPNITISQATTSTNGFLSSTDWNTFNNKVSFTDALARAALSFAAGSGAYNSTTGVITIPTNTNQITNGAGFITLADSTTILAGRWLPNRSADSIAVIRALANSKGVGTVTSVAASAGTGISVSGSPITSSGTITITNTAPDQVVSLTAGTGISVSGTYPNFTVTNSSPSSGGTVTSVGLSAPTGFSVSGSPVTSSGTLALSFAAGYSLPTDASQSNWNTAFNKRLSSASASSTTLTLTLADASTVTTSFPTFNQNTTGTAGSLSAVLSKTLGGAGDVNGILKANGSGVVSAAVAGTDYVIPSALSGYMDLTTNQTAAGNKTFTGIVNVSGASNYLSLNNVGYVRSSTTTNTLDFQSGTSGTNFYNSAYNVLLASVSSTALTSYVPLNGTSLSMSGAGYFGAGVGVANGAFIELAGTFTRIVRSGGIDFETNTHHWQFLDNANTVLPSSGTLLVGGAVTDGTNKLIVNGSAKFNSKVTVSGAEMLTEDGSGNLKIAKSGGSSTSIYSAGAEAIYIATSGAATFSSSVTANDNLTVTKSTGTLLDIRATSSGGTAEIKLNPTSNNSYSLYTAGATDALEFKRNGTTLVTYSNVGGITANSFVKSGGTSAQYLMADGSVTTASAGSSGTYTPTITAVSNVASSTSNQAQYMRVGNVVTVSGYIEVDPTSGSTPTEFRLSLPVATSWSMGSNKAGGVMAGIDGAAVGTIYADVATDTVTFRYTSSASGSNMGISFTFTYLIE